MHLEWRLVIQILKMENELGLHLFCLITSLFSSGTGPGLVVPLSTPSSLCMVLELPGHRPLGRSQGAALAAAPPQQWGWGCARFLPSPPKWSQLTSPRTFPHTAPPNTLHSVTSLCHWIPTKKGCYGLAYFKRLELNKHKESLLRRQGHHVLPHRRPGQAPCSGMSPQRPPSQSSKNTSCFAADVWPGSHRPIPHTTAFCGLGLRWHGKKKNQAANWGLVKRSRDGFLLDVDTVSWDKPQTSDAPPVFNTTADACNGGCNPNKW